MTTTSPPHPAVSDDDDVPAPQPLATTMRTTPAPAFTTLSRQRRRRPAPTLCNGRRPQPCPTTPSPPLAVSDDDDDDVATADTYQHPQLRMTAKIISPFRSGLSTPTQQVSFFLFIFFYFLYNRSATITTTTTSAVSPAYQRQLAQQVFFFPLHPQLQCRGDDWPPFLQPQWINANTPMCQHAQPAPWVALWHMYLAF